MLLQDESQEVCVVILSDQFHFAVPVKASVQFHCHFAAPAQADNDSFADCLYGLELCRWLVGL